MTRTVLVAGASGFVGSQLAAALTAGGHQVRALTRNPERYAGTGAPVYGDVRDPESLAEAMAGIEVAYYLVHSLETADFEDIDADAALNFGGAAADAGVDRIIYLGGLGVDDGDLSAHLRSRRQVEQFLGFAGVPVTVLRAAVVVGHGGISWEITRQLAAQLPLLPVPGWLNTRTQPIALRDVTRYLVGVLDSPQARGRAFEIGGPEVLRYVDMVQRAAQVQGRQLPSVPAPLLPTGLSAAALAALAGVDAVILGNLVESMGNELIVHDRGIQDVVPGACLGYDDAVREALAQRGDITAALP